jgi:hypothetical protein
MPEPIAVEFEVTDQLAARLSRALLRDPDYYQRLAAVSSRAPLLLTIFLLSATLFALWPWLNLLLAVVLVVLFWLGYQALLRYLLFKKGVWAALLPFQGQPHRQLRLTFADDQITLAAAAFTTTVPWADIAEVVPGPDFWLLRLRAGGHFGVPVAVLSPDLQTLIRRQAVAAGATLRGESADGEHIQ